MLSRLVITFLSRSKHLLILWLQSPSAVILEPPKLESATVSPSICYEVMGPDAVILVFWMLSFKSIFSLSSFTFIKRLFSYLLSAIRVVSFAYLRLLTFLPAVLIPACASSSLAFHIMYSAYKLNEQGDNILLWRTPFPKSWCFWTVVLEKTLVSPLGRKEIKPVRFSMSGSNCCFLTVIQVSQEAGKVVWYFQLFKNFPQFLWSTHWRRQ